VECKRLHLHPHARPKDRAPTMVQLKPILAQLKLGYCWRAVSGWRFRDDSGIGPRAMQAGQREHGREGSMIASNWFSVLVTGCLILNACHAQGQSTETSPPPRRPAAAPPSSAPSDTTSWINADVAGKSVMLSLEVTRPSGAGSALINGYRAGQVQVVVPFGWTIKWNWRNQDRTSPHSLVVMTQREKMPLEGGRSAFSNALTRMVTAGLPPGQSDQTTFEVDEAGWYWMLCGVPGHAVAGEWIELQVSRDAATPVIKRKAR
jgi:hypothetical protein